LNIGSVPGRTIKITFKDLLGHCDIKTTKLQQLPEPALVISFSLTRLPDDNQLLNIFLPVIQLNRAEINATLQCCNVNHQSVFKLS